MNRFEILLSKYLDRFTGQSLVAAISALVTNALLDDDPRTALDLHEPLVEVARKMMTKR